MTESIEAQIERATARLKEIHPTMESVTPGDGYHCTLMFFSDGDAMEDIEFMEGSETRRLLNLIEFLTGLK